MGSYASKTWSEVNDYYWKKSAPIEDQLSSGRPVRRDRALTDSAVDRYLDPRSPTQDFDRTPIQVIEYKQKHDSSVIDEISAEALQIIGSSDPRSPTLGIDRTPIDLAVNEPQIDAQMAAMRLSFETTVTDLSGISVDSLLTADDNNQSSMKTPSHDSSPAISGGGQRVRTPLTPSQQMTPNRNILRNRKQLEITKRAHINNHLINQNKTISKTSSNDNTNSRLMSPQVIDDKENF